MWWARCHLVSGTESGFWFCSVPVDTALAALLLNLTWCARLVLLTCPLSIYLFDWGLGRGLSLRGTTVFERKDDALCVRPTCWGLCAQFQDSTSESVVSLTHTPGSLWKHVLCQGHPDLLEVRRPASLCPPD